MQAELRQALAEDLDQLIRLHDRELDSETLAALWAADFPNGLALRPVSEVAETAYGHMQRALRDESGEIDRLAADFAAIYLNNRFGASPYESVWLSDDHLACAAPMFELRERYARAGLEVANWRQRFDDHLVLQLHYLRHCLALAEMDGEDMSHFIDEHLGYWFPDFAMQVSMQCDTAFYATLMELTLVWLQRFREVLDHCYDVPQPSREEVAERINRKLAFDKAEVAPIRFMLGAQGPSW